MLSWYISPPRIGDSDERGARICFRIRVRAFMCASFRDDSPAPVVPRLVIPGVGRSAS